MDVQRIPLGLMHPLLARLFGLARLRADGLGCFELALIGHGGVLSVVVVVVVVSIAGLLRIFQRLAVQLRMQCLQGSV